MDNAQPENHQTAQATAPTKRNPEGYITRFGAIMLCLLTGGVTLAGSHLLNTYISPAARIVVVDDEQIVQAKLQAIMAARLTPEQVQAETQNFVSRLAVIMQGYAERGFVVARARDTLAAPVGTNLTADVARQLNVTLPSTIETLPGRSSPVPQHNAPKAMGAELEGRYGQPPAPGMLGTTQPPVTRDPSSENYDPADPYGLKR